MASPLAMALLQAQAGSGTPQPNVATVAPTNMVQATSDYNTAMEQSYQAQLAQQNAFWGGLAGLGSAGILAGGKYLSTPASGIGGSGLSLSDINTIGGMNASTVPDALANAYGTALGLTPGGAVTASAATPIAATDAAADAAAAGTDAAAAGGG